MSIDYLDHIDYFKKLSKKDQEWLLKFQRAWAKTQYTTRIKDISTMGQPTSEKFLDSLLDIMTEDSYTFLQALGIYPLSRAWEIYKKDRQIIKLKNPEQYSTCDYVPIPARLCRRFEEVINDYIDNSRGKFKDWPESGVPGIIWSRSEKMWHVNRFFEGTKYFLGRFFDIDDAIDTLVDWNRTHAKTGYGVDYV